MPSLPFIPWLEKVRLVYIRANWWKLDTRPNFELNFHALVFDDVSKFCAFLKVLLER